MIPQPLFPDNYAATHNKSSLSLLSYKLREYSLALRASDDPRLLKSGFLQEIYNILAITFGKPPKASEQVKWEYNDKDGKAQVWTGTPLDFYEQFAKDSTKGMDPADSFSLIRDPRHEYGKLYTICRMGNVWGGRLVRCESVTSKRTWG